MDVAVNGKEHWRGTSQTGGATPQGSDQPEGADTGCG